MIGRRPVIGVDLDDVLADRLGAIAGLLRERGRRVDRRQPADWELTDWGVPTKEEYDRLHYAAFVDAPGYRQLAPLPGALEAIEALHRRGYLIRVITGRLWTSQVLLPALADTAHWLTANRVPVDDVTFVSDKTAVTADVYVEDAPHFVTALRAAGRRVVTVGTRYNRHLPGPRATRWDDLVRMVTAAAPC